MHLYIDTGKLSQIIGLQETNFAKNKQLRAGHDPLKESWPTIPK